MAKAFSRVNLINAQMKLVKHAVVKGDANATEFLLKQVKQQIDYILTDIEETRGKKIT